MSKIAAVRCENCEDVHGILAPGQTAKICRRCGSDLIGMTMEEYRAKYGDDIDPMTMTKEVHIRLESWMYEKLKELKIPISECAREAFIVEIRLREKLDEWKKAKPEEEK